MVEQSKRYRAFISYSQKDKAHARRLHEALERYRLPNRVDAAGVDAKTRKLGRFFRDDEEMGATTDLGAALQGAIADAENLIVVCSPNAAQSKWVNEEIIHFKRTGRADNIFAVVVAGAPHSADEEECFPPALRLALRDDGTLSDKPAEPLAVDLRKERFARVLTRLVAGLAQIPFDALWKREQRRAAAQAVALSSALFLVALLVGGALTQSVWYPKVDEYWRYARHAHSTEDLMAAAPGSTFQDCREGSADCPVMVVILEGSAMIGVAANDPEQAFAQPLQQITMPRFAVSQHEITWADWALCVAARRCPELDRSSFDDRLDRWEGDDLPVINVSWNEARAYTDWLKGVTGEDYRLLTEQEWEYAARGVTSAQSAPTRYSWGDDDPVCDTEADNGAAFNECDRQSTWPAGSFRANAFGLYDMHGNVREWTETCFDAEQAGERSDDEPSECSSRVFRGGGWSTGRQNLRSAHRLADEPTWRSSVLGFRVARTV